MGMDQYIYAGPTPMKNPGPAVFECRNELDVHTYLLDSTNESTYDDNDRYFSIDRLSLESLLEEIKTGLSVGVKDKRLFRPLRAFLDNNLDEDEFYYYAWY